MSKKFKKVNVNKNQQAQTDKHTPVDRLKYAYANTKHHKKFLDLLMDHEFVKANGELVLQIEDGNQADEEMSDLLSFNIAEQVKFPDDYENVISELVISALKGLKISGKDTDDFSKIFNSIYDIMDGDKKYDDYIEGVYKELQGYYGNEYDEKFLIRASIYLTVSTIIRKIINPTTKSSSEEIAEMSASSSTAVPEGEVITTSDTIPKLADLLTKELFNDCVSTVKNGMKMIVDDSSVMTVLRTVAERELGKHYTAEELSNIDPIKLVVDMRPIIISQFVGELVMSSLTATSISATESTNDPVVDDARMLLKLYPELKKIVTLDELIKGLRVLPRDTDIKSIDEAVSCFTTNIIEISNVLGATKTSEVLAWLLELNFKDKKEKENQPVRLIEQKGDVEEIIFKAEPETRRSSSSTTSSKSKPYTPCIWAPWYHG